LGYRKDVNLINNASDLFTSSSLREGLPKSVLEAMAIGKVCILSDIRGHHELIKHGENGFLFDPKSPSDFINQFETAKIHIHENHMINQIKETVNRYRIESVIEDMIDIYQNYLGKNV
jgi:glycosyltransferase EpsD